MPAQAGTCCSAAVHDFIQLWTMLPVSGAEQGVDEVIGCV
jgi:hypothetical protein